MTIVTKTLDFRAGVTALRQITAGMAQMRLCFLAEVINQELEDCGGNICRVARQLGMHRNTTSRHIDQIRDAGLLRYQWPTPAQRRATGRKQPQPVTHEVRSPRLPVNRNFAVGI